MSYVAIWLLCGIVSAMIGARKGEGCGGFIVGILLGPFGILISLFSKGNRKTCPHCKELIHEDAKVCSHCQRDVPLELNSPTSAVSKSTFTVLAVFAGIIIIGLIGNSLKKPDTDSSQVQPPKEEAKTNFDLPLVTSKRTLVCPLAILFDNREKNSIQAAVDAHLTIFGHEEAINKTKCEEWKEGIPIVLSNSEIQNAKKFQSNHQCGMAEFANGLVFTCDLKNKEEQLPATQQAAVDDPKHYSGKFPTDVIDDPSVNPQFRQLLGQKYDLFYSNISGPSSVDVSGDYYFGAGCKAHFCDSEQAVFAIDKKNGRIFAASMTEADGNKQFDTFGVSTVSELPPQITSWLKENGARTDENAGANKSNNAADSTPAPDSKPQQVASPSFDCSKANSTSEKLICGDSELSSLDSELSNLYQQAKAKATDQKAFREQTVSEWKWREANCKTKECLVDWFVRRKAQLLTAN